MAALSRGIYRISAEKIGFEKETRRSLRRSLRMNFLDRICGKLIRGIKNQTAQGKVT
jgi:hypothetical protein